MTEHGRHKLASFSQVECLECGACEPLAS